MDAVAVVMIGVGVWVAYAAYKGHDPFTTALDVLKGSQAGVTGSGIPGPSGPGLATSQTATLPTNDNTSGVATGKAE